MTDLLAANRSVEDPKVFIIPGGLRAHGRCRRAAARKERFRCYQRHDEFLEAESVLAEILEECVRALRTPADKVPQQQPG